MAFHDFLESQRNPAQQKESQFEIDEGDNYEEKEPQRERKSNRGGFDDEDSKVLDEVEFYKERLYKKIDSCFIRYGLAGLKKIDEGIATSLARYIDSLNGGTNYEDRMANLKRYSPNYRPQLERVRYRDEELDDDEEEEEVTVRPRPLRRPEPSESTHTFKKPQKIEGSNPNPAPVRKFGEPKLESGAFNPELLNAILTDVIPPTEIHEVEVKSSIPRPVPKTEESVEPAPVKESEEPIEEAHEEHYDIAKDMLAGVSTEDVDLFVPPVIEETTEDNYTSDEELDAPIVENIEPAPEEAEATQSVEEPKKRKRKK